MCKHVKEHKSHTSIKKKIYIYIYFYVGGGGGLINSKNFPQFS